MARAMVEARALLSAADIREISGIASALPALPGLVEIEAPEDCTFFNLAVCKAPSSPEAGAGAGGSVW